MKRTLKISLSPTGFHRTKGMTNQIIRQSHVHTIPSQSAKHVTFHVTHYYHRRTNKPDAQVKIYPDGRLVHGSRRTDVCVVAAEVSRGND